MTNLQNTIQTPPDSAEENQIDERSNTPDMNNTIHVKAGSSRKEAGRKRVLRTRSKSYKVIEKQKSEINKLKKLSEKYRKKYERLKKKKENKLGTDLTPLSKINKMTEGLQVSTEFKKKLLFGEVLSEQLSDNFAKIKDEHSKQIFVKAIGGEKLKKYKLLNLAKSFLPYKIYHSNMKRNNMYLAYERGKKNTIMFLETEVRTFLEHDENSRQCPGKKQTITYKK